MNTKTDFWQIKNDRTVCIQETEDRAFFVFGYLDGLRKKGFRFLGRYETLPLAAETGGAFLGAVDGLTYRYFRTCIAAGRFGLLPRRPALQAPASSN